MCSIEDIEICEKEISEISTVDDDGQPLDHKETDMTGAVFAYYYCDGCQTDWSFTATQTQDRAWELAKEHLDA